MLTVRSNVYGDTVHIDGQARGPTGPTTHELAPGAYTVRMEKPGYEFWERTLTLAAGERETVRAELVPGPRSTLSVPDPGIDEDIRRTGRRDGESWTEPVTGMEFVWAPEAARILALDLAQYQAAALTAAEKLTPELGKVLADGMENLVRVLGGLAGHEQGDDAIH